MKTKQALKIKEAILTLSDYLDMTPQQVGSNVCFLDKERFAKLKAASDIWNTFDNADIVERGKMLGIEVSLSNTEV